MKVDWREEEYEYEPRYIQGGPDKPSNLANVDALFFGSDTESVQKPDRYEPQCFTLSDPFNRDHLIYLPEKAPALIPYLDFFAKQYVDRLIAMGEKNVFLWFHNLGYDWLQLVKEIPILLEMAKIGVGMDTDKNLFRLDSGYQVILKKHALFTGSAPHMGLQLKWGKDYVNLLIRDTFSFFPASLGKVMEDLGLNQGKLDRQEDLGIRDFREVPDGDPDKEYFEKYAKIDAWGTRMIGEKGIRPLHKDARMQRIRVSAPSYAIGLLFTILGEERQIKTGSDDQAIMQLIFNTYRGGRTGGIYHGRVEHVSVLDFHSSYPASMLALPSFSPSMEYVRVDDLSLENVLDILEETGNAFLRVSGVERDPKYPSLITIKNGMLTPIFGEFEDVATTGVELLVGIRSGTLEITEVHEMIVLLDFDEDPFLPFREFATRYYEDKKKAGKGTVQYSKSKLALNASYGKLIESRSQTMVGAEDGQHLLPFVSTMEKQFGAFYYEKYVEGLEDGHDNWYEQAMEEILANFDETTIDEMQYKMFQDFNISGRIYGRNVVPAAASLITATSRARLCAGMKILEALYWDTDSKFIRQMSLGEITERLEVATFWLPKNVRDVIPLRIGEELGDLAFEIEDAEGYLAGTKRYYLTRTCPDCQTTRDFKFVQLPGCKECKGTGIIKKTATHGIPALPPKETESVIRSLATGSGYEYDSKGRPLKAKEAKRVEDIGSFRSNKYRPKFQLDSRLIWQETDAGWIGTIQEYDKILEKLPDQMTIAQFEKMAQKELSDLSLLSRIQKQIGFIRIPDPGSRFRSEYERIPRSVRAKLFRRDLGIPLDEVADELKLPLNELLTKLQET